MYSYLDDVSDSAFFMVTDLRGLEEAGVLLVLLVSTASFLMSGDSLSLDALNWSFKFLTLTLVKGITTLCSGSSLATVSLESFLFVVSEEAFLIPLEVVSDLALMFPDGVPF